MLTTISRVIHLIIMLGWIYYLCGLYNKCFIRLHDEDAKGMVAMGIFAETIVIIYSLMKVITG